MAIKNLGDIHFPPVGGDKPFQVTCDGKPFAGFDTYKEAEAAREMYARLAMTVKRVATYGSTRDWRVVCK